MGEPLQDLGGRCIHGAAEHTLCGQPHSAIDHHDYYDAHPFELATSSTPTKPISQTSASSLSPTTSFTPMSPSTGGAPMFELNGGGFHQAFHMQMQMLMQMQVQDAQRQQQKRQLPSSRPKIL
jgi:hypothetical protein